MRLTPVPVVSLLRELWSKPRDMARFHEYVGKIQQGPDGEIFAPLIAANPMAKPHMVEFADKLLALGADKVLADACAEAERRVAKSPLAVKVSLTPIDDIGGAWSDRDMVDFDMRFGSKRPKKDYGYVTAVAYVSEPVDAALLRERILAAVYRAAFSAKHGYAERVRDMLRQEGMALRFAQDKASPSASPPLPRAAEAETVRRALAPHLDSTLHATRVAAMFGDASAQRVGHAALGIPEHGGIALALHDALASREWPEDLV